MHCADSAEFAPNSHGSPSSRGAPMAADTALDGWGCSPLEQIDRVLIFMGYAAILIASIVRGRGKGSRSRMREATPSTATVPRSRSGRLRELLGERSRSVISRRKKDSRAGTGTAPATKRPRGCRVDPATRSRDGELVTIREAAERLDMARPPPSTAGQLCRAPLLACSPGPLRRPPISLPPSHNDPGRGP